MRATLVLMLGFTLACATGGDDEEDTDDGFGGFEGDADADSDADGDADADADADADGGCPAYSGIRSGASSTWEYTSAAEQDMGISGTFTSVVTDVSGGTFTTEMTTDFESDFYDEYALASTAEGWCDADGMWIGQMYSETTVVYEGDDYGGTSLTIYDDGYLSLPADLADGSEWSGVMSGTTEYDGGDPDDFEVEYAYDASDGGTVDTPAGTFGDTLYVTNGDSGWYVDRTVGSLGDGEYYELIAYD